MSRVFVGVELDESIREAAASVAMDLQSRLGQAAPRAQVRWVHPSNLHITLWFIGEIDEARVVAVSGALSGAYQTAAFDTWFAGAGTFPISGPPRVIWMSTRSDADAWTSLHRETEERLVRLGFEPERRPYTAHLTIGRVKEARRSEASAIRRVLADVPVDLGPMRVPAVTFFRSHLSPRGSRYETLMRVPLR